MDARLPRASITKKNDPHEWNSYDHYRTIHETRLSAHPFVDHSRPNTVEFEFIDFDGVLFLWQIGQVHCLRSVVLDVEKLFETRKVGSKNLMQIRGISYRYIAWIPNGHLVLKYHNLHEDPGGYHHRAYDCHTGQEILYERLTRAQFPIFTEVLDEMDSLTAE